MGVISRWSGRLARTNLIHRVCPAPLLQTISASWRLRVRCSFDGASVTRMKATYTDSIGCVGRSIRSRILVVVGSNEEGSHTEARRRREEEERRSYERCSSCEILCTSRSPDLTPLRPGETLGPPSLHGPLPGHSPLGAGEGERNVVPDGCHGQRAKRVGRGNAQRARDFIRTSSLYPARPTPVGRWPCHPAVRRSARGRGKEIPSASGAPAVVVMRFSVRGGVRLDLAAAVGAPGAR